MQLFKVSNAQSQFFKILTGVSVTAGVLFFESRIAFLTSSVVTCLKVKVKCFLKYFLINLQLR